MAQAVRARHGVLVAGLLLLAACASAPEDLNPTDAAVDSSLRAAARASEQVQNYSGAVAHYASLYEREPEDLEIAFHFAQNLRFLGDVDRAIMVLELALEKHPDDTVLLAEYGRALLASDRPADALVPLRRVADADAKDWRVRSAMGIAYDLLEQTEAATAAFEAALAISPNNSVVLNNLALSQTMTGDIEAGVATLRRALLYAGSGIQERQNLAVLLALSGRLAEAEKLIEADLPRDMARLNVAYVRRLAAAQAEGATVPEVLEALPVLTSLPKLEPVPATAEVLVESVPAPEPAAAATEAAEADTAPTETTAAESEDFANAAAQAAEAAFAALVSGGATEDTGQGLFGAQLASYNTEIDATAGRDTLAGALGAIGQSLRIVPVERSGEPTLYRIYAGPFAPVEAAKAMCENVRTAGQGCVVSPAP